MHWPPGISESRSAHHSLLDARTTAPCFHQTAAEYLEHCLLTAQICTHGREILHITLVVQDSCSTRLHTRRLRDHPEPYTRYRYVLPVPATHIPPSGNFGRWICLVGTICDVLIFHSSAHRCSSFDRECTSSLISGALCPLQAAYLGGLLESANY